jgi:hypothetical protein
MIRDIPKPDISPAFTIDDIHKIREWDYERLKDATPEERRTDTESRAERTRRTIEELRRSRAGITGPEKAPVLAVEK